MTRLALIDQIKQLGFSDYEAKCYLALFERESLSVSEISKLAKIPRSNAYETTENLLTKGLIVSIPGKIKKYSVSDPKILHEKSIELFEANAEAELEALERKRREILEIKKKEIEKRKRIVQESVGNIVGQLGAYFAKNRGNGDPFDHIEVLKNRDQLHRKHSQLCAKAKSEILGFSKPPFAFTSLTLKKEQTKILIDAVNRGVKLRSIHELPPDNALKQEVFKNLNRLYEPKYEEVRLIDKLPHKLSIYDTRIVLLSLEYPILNEMSLTGIVIEHPDFASSQKRMFETYWKDSMDYYILDGRKYYLSKTNSQKEEHN